MGIFEGDQCTIRIWPLSEPGEVWHLGEPFLRRFGVTLDAPRRRLGFSPPPPQGLADLVDEDLLQIDVVEQPHQQGFFREGSVTNSALLFIPVAFFAALAAHYFVATFRGAAGRWERREVTRHQWQPVPTSPHDSADELSSDSCSSEENFYAKA